MTAPRTILLVEDDEVFRERLARALRARGYEVQCAGDVQAALTAARQMVPTFAIIDLRLPGGSGLDVISAIHGFSAKTVLYLLTGAVSAVVEAEAVSQGATGCLRKPIDADQIIQALERSTPHF